MGGGEMIYNPYSLLKYISEGEEVNGWLETSSNDLAKEKIRLLMENSGNKKIVKEMEGLYNGSEVEIEPVDNIEVSNVKDMNGILSLLLYAGYLTFEYGGKEGERRDKRLKVRIPNEEVREEFETVQEMILEERYKEDDFLKLLESIEVGKEEEIEKNMRSQLLGASFHDFSGKNMEKDYHNFVHGMIGGMVRKYEIKSNREAGMGRCDIILMPRDVMKQEGIVIELKAENSAKESESREKAAEKISKEAIKQIKEEKYFEEM